MVAHLGVCTVQVAEDAVHVPLDVVHIRKMPGFAERLEEVGTDVLTGEVEQILVAPDTGSAPWDGDHPLGVFSVELAFDAHHLRLYPKAEHHAQAMDFQGKATKARGEFLGVHRPVAKAGGVVVAQAEPAVVQDEELHAELGTLLCEVEQLVLGEVEVGRFPVVDEHRPFPELPRSPDNVVVHKVVEVGARSVQALV
ncbi:hypothetical protein SDC9_174548 [bioreactor metagenome]|uniref:Uncharacterized protein n=1 Tax=bioreactor metagenome TaxID=1076179 RepID=A0A645GJH8_9ZZZZ